MTYRKKLIEVALPLEAINEASAREKFIRHGHPSTLHLWWARRPLAACRAVIFTSLVDDPDDPEAPADFVEACRRLPRGANAAENDTPRQRLFDFIERLVQWESTTDEAVLGTARELIKLCTDGNPPPLLDPFAGGGSIPLEAQRLGLEAHASDLNPVAVTIAKALIEAPPEYANQPPANPRDRRDTSTGASWAKATGLAADIRYYGEWILQRARDQIGYLYPDCNGETVIAWLWARTVTCPNPVCRATMPLVRSFALNKRKDRKAWVEPQVDRRQRQVRFVVRHEDGPIREGTVSRRGATCLVCKASTPLDYVRSEGNAGRIKTQLLAIVTKGDRRRNYYTPSDSVVPGVARSDFLENVAITEISGYLNPPLYGYRTVNSMFIDRQLLALRTFADLVGEARDQLLLDGASRAYARSVSLYLTLGVGRLANRLSSFAIWNTGGEKIEQTFSEQGVAMAWDFAEANPFSGATGSWEGSLEWIPKCVETCPSAPRGYALQRDAADEFAGGHGVIISTDPPYYSSITYADFADFFYGPFRYTLKEDYPGLFGTIATPKVEEAVAAWHRFEGNRDRAGEHFRAKLRSAIESMVAVSGDYPLTIFYAFKEKELGDAAVAYLTAWESILSVLIEGGLQVVRTWPIRTEMTSGRKKRKNVLASSIILTCRPLDRHAPLIPRRDFTNALRQEIPAALEVMQSGNIAPVDLAQASIGPGMAVYSRYSKVLEPDGRRMTVRTALQLINQELDAYLAEQEGHVDKDSRFAVAWFEQFGFQEGPFGQADVLARAKNTSVEGLAYAGVLESGAGKVRLLRWSELEPGWDPATDKRLTIWEMTHHLIERLNTHGEHGAAMLLARMPADLAAQARQLAYRLYSICERKGWAEQARDYNALVISWGASQEQAREYRQQYQQSRMFE